MANAENERNSDLTAESESSGVKMKKELSLLDGVAIIVGVIIGSGIFVSPKGVLMSSGSIGQALIVWVMSGILSMIGALCYAELGKSFGRENAQTVHALRQPPRFWYILILLLVHWNE